MANILKRTVFCDDKNGYLLFADWAMCIVEINGQKQTMFEPFKTIGLRRDLASDTDLTDYDPSDEMCRIDEIRIVPQSQWNKMFSMGGHIVMGGVTNRTGK